jgi:di/tricarboxylate transporter
VTWRRPLPILVGTLIAVLPTPPGLTLEGWRYFAIFVAVIVSLITESLPGAATGLIG